jgi:hypothetical protein
MHLATNLTIPDKAVQIYKGGMDYAVNRTPSAAICYILAVAAASCHRPGQSHHRWRVHDTILTYEPLYRRLA